MSLKSILAKSYSLLRCYKLLGTFSRACTCQPPLAPIDHNKKGLVLGVYSCGGELVLSAETEKADIKFNGKINEAVKEMGDNSFKTGRAVTLTNIDTEIHAVAVVNIGPKDAGYNKLEELDESQECVRVAVGAGVRALQQRGCGQVAVDTTDQPSAAAEAAHLAAWSFQEFKEYADRAPSCEVKPHSTGNEAALQNWCAGAISGIAQNWARYLIQMPPNKMTPMDFAQGGHLINYSKRLRPHLKITTLQTATSMSAIDLVVTNVPDYSVSCGSILTGIADHDAQAALECLCPLGVRGEARDDKWMRARRMEATAAVAQGSCAPPVLLDVSYYGGPSDQPPVLICGEGITFDSGGLCLKSSDQQSSCGGPAGAAVAVAALKAIVELKIPINVVVLAPLCENLVSGKCMKPGDVVRALNGMNIEIENTDNDGRLVLADALIYGQSEYKPSVVVDVANLTSGIQRATGGGCFGCYSNSETLWQHMQAAGAHSGDRPWRFPLWKYYNNKVTGASVDLLNMGTGKESSCLGAAFLHSFVCTDWLHLDIGGVCASPTPVCPAPSYLAPALVTGRPVRALVQLLCRLAASNVTAATNETTRSFVSQC